LKGKIFDVRARFKGVISVTIDVPKEKFNEGLIPGEDVELLKIKKI